MLFNYADSDLVLLASKDLMMSKLIAKVGRIDRECYDDLYTALVYTIVGQQVSAKVQATLMQRLLNSLPSLDYKSFLHTDSALLRNIGLSFRKIEYLKSLALNIDNGQLDLEALKIASDDKVIKILSAQKGVGVWTAQMALIFGLQRKDVLAFDDFAIKKGLCLLYGHERMDKSLFKTYQERFSPVGTLASFYLWHYANNNGKV